MPLPTSDDVEQELGLLFAAADDFRAESPRPTTSGEKRSSPDDDQNGDDSAREDEVAGDHGNENQASRLE